MAATQCWSRHERLDGSVEHALSQEMETKKHSLSASDLEAHLSDQIGALQRSVSLFDDGYELEARRIAVILRVILHSGRYPSLLKQLARDNLDFVDSASPIDLDNLLPFYGLISIQFRDGKASYAPKLDTESPVTLTPFARWWKNPVFVDNQKRKMSRADVVLTAADQDGGAHIDGALRADYAALRHGWWVNDQGWPLPGDPRYIAIRQIAHEVLKTFIPGYAKTVCDVHGSRKNSEISVGKLRFFPHEKLFFGSKTISPLVPGRMYVTEIMVDSITTGCVRMVVNSAATGPGDLGWCAQDACSGWGGTKLRGFRRVHRRGNRPSFYQAESGMICHGSVEQLQFPAAGAPSPAVGLKRRASVNAQPTEKPGK